MLRKSLIALMLSIGVSSTSIACTGISLSTNNNHFIHARTIEWGENNLESKLIVSPKKHHYTSMMPDNSRGMEWDSRLGFVGISVSSDRFIAEGLNEAGLNAGLFYFKGYGSLQPYDKRTKQNTITDMDFVRWMLSQFKTVDEVLAAMKKINIVPVYLDADGKPSPTAHWRVTDKTGRSVVIEIVNQGEVNVYENEVGVLTNAPTFPWQLTNLNNYLNLQPGSSAPRKYGNVEAKSFGVGSGFLGLPGDITSPSRFIRAAFYTSTVPELKTPEQAVSQAFHILNNFDIPIGSEFGPQHRDHIPDISSATQWVSVVDQTSGVLYYKTMNDSQIKKIALNRLNFSVKNETKRPLDSGVFKLKDISQHVQPVINNQ